MNPDLEGLDLLEMLDLLQMPPDPAPVPYTPQTAGWLVVGAVALLLLVLALWRLVRWWRGNAYRRAALAALQDAGDDPARIASVLRRTAIAAYSREEVARLYGPAWLAFLDRSFHGSGFAEGPGQVLAVAAYRPGTPADPALPGLAAQWVRKHRRTAR
ncbi:DUF4381 domain-containing protein [Paracoccus aerodenitrificans]|uniref:DUF4381 domain-containing protein n=1 Tax=Paracoccus aerodenitrificans TaxID=3017781 RepID=UPI0022EFF54A|nr:DUF4381 domain-containing protein [Paracoccus aerodenitrificans]WBU63788.1 DUF4381 domain-containing protein [Paracoccus aerodenitrificans]